MGVKHAILWDLDGTIVETKACHLFAFQQTFAKYGFSLEEAAFDANFGRNNAALVEIFLGFDPDPSLKADLIDYKEALFRKTIPDQIKLVTGVESWLSAAEALHYPQAIASSGPMQNISIMLSSLNLEGYFKAIVSGADLPAKPEPDVFLQAAETLHVSPRDCLVIEDAIAGVEAAHNAGMQCIAVTSSHSREELSLADIVVDDFLLSFHDVLKTLGWAY